jgi:GT2 family glycosyltransferase
MVSIIIVNYHTSHLLLHCVDAIEEQVKGVDYEIIVADNASSEEELVLLRDDKRFTLLELDENVGFGNANNAAAQMAKGDYLLLLNPDTVLLNDAVTLLFQYMDAHPEVGICGGNLYDSDLQPTHSFHRLYPSFLSEMDFALGQVYRKIRFRGNAQFNRSEHPIEVAMITGADLMIRTDVWNKLKGFDTIFFMYGEDADLCKRCKQLGYSVVAIPEVHIQHLEGKSFIESESHCRRILDGRFTYFNKHYGTLYNKLTDAMNILSLHIAVFIYRLRRNERAVTKFSNRLRIYKEYATKHKLHR